jgi:hypothetical protein
MTTNHPNMNLPEGSGTMTGIQRAKSMKNIKVKIADMGGNGAGLAVVHPDVQMRHLDKAREYV